jgi:heme/copper-type cytochrome/quinol oxidase subunit 2
MNMVNTMIALDIMWKGMLGIFVVIVVIMLSVLFLSKITKEKTDKKNDVADNK